MTKQELIIKHAAELTEELLDVIRRNVGTPWFCLIERKMQRLAEGLLPQIPPAKMRRKIRKRKK